jgi:hypothetical protein
MSATSTLNQGTNSERWKVSYSKFRFFTKYGEMQTFVEKFNKSGFIEWESFLQGLAWKLCYYFVFLYGNCTKNIFP